MKNSKMLFLEINSKAINLYKKVENFESIFKKR